MESYRITINSINFVLVDTPGFNDTHRTDGDILKAIAGWLNTTYRQGAKLTGIIYLHPIKNVRMEGTSLMNFRAFQRLCGEETFEHIVLCTTFWDLVSASTGAAREKELCEDFWAKMKSQGSRVVRIHDYAESKDILLQMARKSTVTLDIQKEMVEERRSLDDTNVGRTINAQMAQMKAEHEALLAKTKLDHEALLKKRDEENRRRNDEQLKRHKTFSEMQQKMLEEQQRLMARMQEDRRQADAKAAEEKKKIDAIEAENKRLEAEKERLLNERKRREAEERRALAENHKRTVCRAFRAEFASQTQALDRAKSHRMVVAKLYSFHQQTPAFLRWCDRCFELIGFRAFCHCEPCSLYICASCWTHGQRCKAEAHHQPTYKKDTTPQACCRRLKERTGPIRCDRCTGACQGLHFPCCNCLNDDFDICLKCVVTSGACRNPQHWLHPTVSWPT